MVKIYFSGSITGGSDDRPRYQKIVDLLEKHVHGEVLSKFVAYPDLEKESNDWAVRGSFYYLLYIL